MVRMVTSRPLPMKEPHAEHTTNTAALDTFLAEARTLAGLDQRSRLPGALQPKANPVSIPPTGPPSSSVVTGDSVSVHDHEQTFVCTVTLLF